MHITSRTSGNSVCISAVFPALLGGVSGSCPPVTATASHSTAPMFSPHLILRVSSSLPPPHIHNCPSYCLSMTILHYLWSRISPWLEARGQYLNHHTISPYQDMKCCDMSISCLGYEIIALVMVSIVPMLQHWYCIVSCL